MKNNQNSLCSCLLSLLKTLLLHKYADINSVLYTHRASLVYRYLHFSWMCNIPKNCLPVCFNLIFKEFKIYLSVGEVYVGGPQWQADC